MVVCVLACLIIVVLGVTIVPRLGFGKIWLILESGYVCCCLCCLTAWILALCVCSHVWSIWVCVCVCLCLVVACLCMFPLWVISWQCWEEAMLNNSSTPFCRCLHCPKIVFQFASFSAEIVPLYFGVLAYNCVLPSNHCGNCDFSNFPCDAVQHRGPILYPSRGGPLIRQVAATTENQKHKAQGPNGFGHASCLQVITTKGPLKHT